MEELLDSQTISGCRKVFDYLESRREKITSKHFEQKKLVILRTCNELLRRLSRAEDTAFCGRVFIFMFQSFPLGDKSSVNLRGEYHVENETTFDQDFKKDGSAEKMDVDPPSNGVQEASDTKASSKAASSDGKTSSQTASRLDPDQLYPVFWSLQSIFSQPKKLFEPAHLAQFKAGIEATMATFSTIKPEAQKQKQEKDKQGEDTKRSPKEKAEDGDDELANAFNPKYLTSRDLFELEVMSTTGAHIDPAANSPVDQRFIVSAICLGSSSDRLGLSAISNTQSQGEVKHYQSSKQVCDVLRPGSER